MLTLSSDAEFTNYVTPVCLWEERTDDLDDIVDKEGTVRIIFFAKFYESFFKIVFCTFYAIKPIYMLHKIKLNHFCKKKF